MAEIRAKTWKPSQNHVFLLVFWDLWGTSGTLLGGLWGVLGGSWGSMGALAEALGILLGASWKFHLASGSLWALFRAKDDKGRVLDGREKGEYLETCFSGILELRLGSFLEVLEASGERPGGLWGPRRSIWGASWELLEGLLERLGSLLGASWGQGRLVRCVS